MRILVIEDDATVGRYIQRFLEGGGYQVEIASNGREGLEALAAGPADVLISDLIMPELDGLETIREVRRLYPAVKILAISTSSNTGAQDRLAQAREFGAHETLLRPFQKEELLKTLDAMAFDEGQRASSLVL